MANLAIEQKLNEHGQPNGGQPGAAPNYVNLGGFAVSFEDLLQRVGARLESAYAGVDKGAAFPAARQAADAGADTRDYANAREASGSNNDHRRDGEAAERGRSVAEDTRDTGPARSDDAPRSDNAADNASERDGNADRDAQGATDKTDKADNGKSNDNATDDGASEAADGNSDGNSDGKNAENGDGKAAADSPANKNASETAQNATQAAAVYAAGLIGSKGQQTANAAQAEHQTQAQKGVDITENTALQAAAGKAANNGANNHKLARSNQQAQAKTASGAEQKAGAGEQRTQGANTQNQAQQLARAIGGDSRTTVNIDVSKEQAAFTSKPTFTIANSSVLTADGAASKGNAQNGQAGQQQGQNQGQTQQAQLAAQQQAQAAQQANVQNGAQGVQGGSAQGGTTATASVQSSTGGAQHAGGSEHLNNASQTANTAQQTQQTQQTRDAQPQQQAQQAQRGNLPGSAVTEQISVKITKALQAGTDRISIQLKPAELGRVDVKLEMTHDGRVMTVVTAEKQDTLEMLRRDSSELQRALAEAGLQSGDMQFNLKGQEQQSAEAEGDGASGNSAGDADAADNGETDVNDGVMSAWESGIFANGRLDMRA